MSAQIKYICADAIYMGTTAYITGFCDPKAAVIAGIFGSATMQLARYARVNPLFCIGATYIVGYEATKVFNKQNCGALNLVATATALGVLLAVCDRIKKNFF